LDCRELIGESIEEIEKFISQFRIYVIDNDWNKWDSPQIARQEGAFQLKMQNKIAALEVKVISHKKKFEAFKQSGNKKVFVELDNSLQTYSSLLNRLKEHLSVEGNKWFNFVNNYATLTEGSEASMDWYKNLINQINESHEEALFQIEFMIKIDAAIDSLETFYGIDIDEKETIKLRGGSDANPMTEYYLKTKRFTND